jgi:hypothetical protein
MLLIQVWFRDGSFLLGRSSLSFYSGQVSL